MPSLTKKLGSASSRSLKPLQGMTAKSVPPFFCSWTQRQFEGAEAAARLTVCPRKATEASFPVVGIAPRHPLGRRPDFKAASMSAGKTLYITV